MSNTEQYLSKERVEIPGPTPDSGQVKYNEGDPIDPNDHEELVRQGFMTKKEAKEAAKAADADDDN